MRETGMILAFALLVLGCVALGAWLVIENVRGLTFHKTKSGCKKGKEPKPDACPGCYFVGVVLVKARERFPAVEWRILDAADFGTPQHRRRVITVCGPKGIAWPAPTHAREGEGGLLPHVTMRIALSLGSADVAYPTPPEGQGKEGLRWQRTNLRGTSRM